VILLSTGATGLVRPQLGGRAEPQWEVCSVCCYVVSTEYKLIKQTDRQTDNKCDDIDIFIRSKATA